MSFRQKRSRSARRPSLLTALDPGVSQKAKIREYNRQQITDAADHLWTSSGGDLDTAGGIGTLPEALSKKVLEEARRQRLEEDGSGVVVKRTVDKRRRKTSVVDKSVDELGIELSVDDVDAADELWNFDEEEDLQRFSDPSKLQKTSTTLADKVLKHFSRLEHRISNDVHGTALTKWAGEDKTDLLEQEIGDMPAVEATTSSAAKVYATVAKFMKKYKSGRLPKPFTIIPRLKNWEDALMMTEPHNWSPHALNQATKLFASNLNPKMAQRFYNLVLLPAFRDNLSANRKVDPHIFAAVKKAMFKPDAWFKGILLPLAMDRCNYAEAITLTAVLKRISVPVLHAAASLMRLAQLEDWTGSVSILISAIVEKQYTLPSIVVDELVNHFCSFGPSGSREHASLPLVWHRCLLSFSQRYKSALSTKQRAELRSLLKSHRHHLVTQEVERELFEPVGNITAGTAKRLLRVSQRKLKASSAMQVG